MKSKLTLSIDHEIKKKAELYASENGQPLNSMVENYLKLLSNDIKQVKPDQLSPRVRGLRGIIKVEKGFDSKKMLSDELSKKYEI